MLNCTQSVLVVIQLYERVTCFTEISQHLKVALQSWKYTASYTAKHVMNSTKTRGVAVAQEEEHLPTNQKVRLWLPWAIC